MCSDDLQQLCTQSVLYVTVIPLRGDLSQSQGPAAWLASVLQATMSLFPVSGSISCLPAYGIISIRSHLRDPRLTSPLPYTLLHPSCSCRSCRGPLLLLLCAGWCLRTSSIGPQINASGVILHEYTVVDSSLGLLLLTSITWCSLSACY